MYEVQLPYKLVVPVKVKEEVVEDPEPFYRKRVFWAFATAVVSVLVLGGYFYKGGSGK